MNNNYQHLGQILIKAGKLKEAQLDKALDKQKILNMPLGEILSNEFSISSEYIYQSLNFQNYQKTNKVTLIKDKIGKILKYIGVITDKEINETLFEQINTSKRFGEILVEKNLIKPRFLDEVLAAIDGNNDAVIKLTDKKLGELLVDLNYLNDDQLQPLLSEQSRMPRGKRLGKLISEKGLLSFAKIEQVLNIQKKLASLTMVTFLSTSILAGCNTPRVSTFSTVENYANSDSSNGIKVLNTNSATNNVNFYNDGTVAIANIPFFQQGNDNTCGQAVMASVLNFWGVDVSYQTVVNQTNAGNSFTDISNITNYLRKKGLYSQDYRQATLNFVKDRIQKGNPVILLLDFGKLSSEHYVLATGYNDKTEEIILMDPIDGPNIKMSYEEMENRWENKSLKKVGIFGDKYSRIVFDITSNN